MLKRIDSFIESMSLTQVITMAIGLIVAVYIALNYIPETTTVNALTMDGAITHSNVIEKGQVQSTIKYANGKTYQVCYGNQVNPMFTTIQMTDWVLRKGNQTICILQELAYPFCVITFIIASFMTLLGCITKNAGQGLVGMSMSGICYALILYAPTIVNLVVTYVS